LQPLAGGARNRSRPHASRAKRRGCDSRLFWEQHASVAGYKQRRSRRAPLL